MQLALYIILALIVLGVIAATMGWLHNRHVTEEEDPVKKVLDMECCGQHEVCEKESLLAALSKQVEYYNDEELDRFRGRRPDAFSSDETEEFREVLYTMRSDEVAGWVRSLQLRGVELPEELRDEVLMIVGERRQ
ncbi:MAG: phospholipase [Bacteroidaceae bacterium]|nr:phospholipase [Bacteroidaceae bacterium]